MSRHHPLIGKLCCRIGTLLSQPEPAQALMRGPGAMCDCCHDQAATFHCTACEAIRMPFVFVCDACHAQVHQIGPLASHQADPLLLAPTEEGAPSSMEIQMRVLAPWIRSDSALGDTMEVTTSLVRPRAGSRARDRIRSVSVSGMAAVGISAEASAGAGVGVGRGDSAVPPCLRPTSSFIGLRPGGGGTLGGAGGVFHSIEEALVYLAKGYKEYEIYYGANSEQLAGIVCLGQSDEVANLLAGLAARISRLSSDIAGLAHVRYIRDKLLKVRVPEHMLCASE